MWIKLKANEGSIVLNLCKPTKDMHEKKVEIDVHKYFVAIFLFVLIALFIIVSV